MTWESFGRDSVILNRRTRRRAAVVLGVVAAVAATMALVVASPFALHAFSRATGWTGRC